VFHPKFDDLLNGWHDAIPDAPQHILLALDVSDEPTSLYTDNRFAA